MTPFRSLTYGAIAILASLSGPPASAQPPRNTDPPTYDCEPGTPDPSAKTCRCPNGFEPHVHENRVPFCRKLPRHSRAPKPPAPGPRGIACGDLAPRVSVACVKSCGDVQRDSLPSPWNSDAPRWIPLDEQVATTKRSCSHGPAANALVEASCALEARHLSLGITASASRAGDCAACADSGASVAFEWRTRVPKQSHTALFLKGTQTKGITAAKRCSLQVGAQTWSWADVEAGLVRSLDDNDLDLHLRCMDPSAGLVSAGCHATDDAVALAIDLETGPVPAPNIAAAGTYEGPPGFDHGMQAVRHCGNNPESWVRGSAKLDTDTGMLGVDIELETDSIAAGPKGRISVEILGDGGKLLVTVESSEIGIGGKPPGRAVSRNYSAHTQLRDYVAKRAAKLTIHAACTGTAQQLYGIGSDPGGAFGLTVK